MEIRSVFDPSAIIVEIRFGEGGDDSKDFVETLGSMYLTYAASRGLKTELLSTDYGWFAFEVKGQGVWQAFKNEGGKHVVQRCPKNGGGRRHTSTVSVAVMPILKSQAPRLRESDLDIKTQGGSGPGGQHQNKTDSAVRMTHKPTGLQVFINGRSQYQNKQKAMEILASRVASLEEEKRHSQHNERRQEQIGGGSRSGKARTYNFLQSRVTDHRTGRKTRNIKEVMKGNLDCLSE